MAIFSKFFGDIIILIIRVNADERIKKNFYIFSIKNLEYAFVCFSKYSVFTSHETLVKRTIFFQSQ